MVADGLAAILPHARASHIPLAIEPLPSLMYAWLIALARRRFAGSA